MTIILTKIITIIIIAMTMMVFEIARQEDVTIEDRR